MAACWWRISPASARPRPCSRDKLIDALWPEGAATDAAAATLTVLLSRERALLGPATIQGRAALPSSSCPLARSSTSRWQLPALHPGGVSFVVLE